MGFQVKTGVLWQWGGEEWTFDWRKLNCDFRSSFHVRREKFDEMLLRHAQSQGVKVHEGVGVSESSSTGGTPVAADWAADGTGETGRLRLRLPRRQVPAAPASWRPGTSSRAASSRRSRTSRSGATGRAPPGRRRTSRAPSPSSASPTGRSGTSPSRRTSTASASSATPTTSRRRRRRPLDIYRENIASSELISRLLGPGTLVSPMSWSETTRIPRTGWPAPATSSRATPGASSILCCRAASTSRCTAARWRRRACRRCCAAR